MSIKIPKLLYNFDKKEIDKFELMATDWWNIEGKFKILHQINPLRLNYITQRSCGLFGKKILEIGCGGGILAEGMARKGAIVTGIDMGTNLLKIANSHALKSGLNINYIQETAEEHAINNIHKYDIVTCMEVLEHVINPFSIVKSCSQLVKLGGEVFFSTINRNIKSWLLAIIGAEYILKIVPKGTHNIKKFIRPSELLNWIDQTCLQEKHITGLHYNPLTNKFWIAPGIDINYILHTKSINIEKI